MPSKWILTSVYVLEWGTPHSSPGKGIWHLIWCKDMSEREGNHPGEGLRGKDMEKKRDWRGKGVWHDKIGQILIKVYSFSDQFRWCFASSGFMIQMMMRSPTHWCSWWHPHLHLTHGSLSVTFEVMLETLIIVSPRSFWVYSTFRVLMKSYSESKLFSSLSITFANWPCQTNHWTTPRNRKSTKSRPPCPIWRWPSKADTQTKSW